MTEKKIDFTGQEISLILKGLGKLPAEESFSLITKILNNFENDNRDSKNSEGTIV
jgi:hypothetical protein